VIAVAIVGLCVVAYLYYRPLKSYFETRDTLAERKAEVRALLEEKHRLEERLQLNESGATLVRAARRLNLVKPGERLVIVQGITAWRRAHAALRNR
jgi:hypothetical protein